MSEEEKYDELIRQKFAEKEFMFNEANWEKAEVMIDSSRKTKKIFWWSAVFLVGLITGIFLMIPLIKNDSLKITNETKLNNPLITDSLSNETEANKNDDSEKLTSDDSSQQDAPVSSPITGKHESAEAAALTNQSQTTTEALNNTKGNASASTKNRSTGNADDALQKNKFSATSGEESDSKDVLKDSKTNTSATAVRNSKKNKNRSEADQDHSQSTKANKQLLASQKEKQGKKTSGTEKNIYALGYERTVIKNANPHIPKTGENVKKEVKEGDKKNETEAEETAAGETTESASEAEKKAELTKKDATDSTNTENKSAEEIAAKIDALNDSVKQEEKKLAAADSVQKSDSAKVAAQDKSITPALDGLAKATFLTIDGGINGHLGWKNNEVIEGRGITPVLGVGITHAFNQTWSVSSGIYYNGIGYLKGDSKTTNTTTYDFGSTTTISITKPHFLHYITVPLLIQYHFNDKNAIMAGGSFAYLLNTKSKVEESMTYVRPFDSLLAPNSSNDYRTKTFNMFDAAVSVGYRRKISSRFSIAAIANFGLLDIKPKPFFLNNTIERNSSLKVILSYTIFDF